MTSLFARFVRLGFAILAVVVGPLSVRAQHLPHTEGADTYDFYRRGPYRAEVPRPSAILGYEAGETHTTFRDQERTLLAIATAAKDRVRVFDYGKSVEGRPLRLFAVSMPENLARLESIRTDIGRLADPRGLSDADADRIVHAAPCITWINHCIHGSETASFESVMWTLYTLAASRAPEIEGALKNAVVILNPVFNPDGHERFVVYYNSVTVGSPEPYAFEKRQPWAIEGRFNHFRFDMNRDKLAQSQPEVRQETAAFLHWRPQVFADEHGEPDVYFFPPNSQATNRNVDRARLEKWTSVFGKANGADFDRHSWRYVNRDTFDFFYPGYLDTWTTLSGAIGMTYETDGGGNLARRREDGTISTLRDGAAHHFETALTTIETAATRREELLRDYLAYRRETIAAGNAGPMRRIVILPGADPNRAAELAELLIRVGIEVKEATGSWSSSRAHAYLPEEGVRRLALGDKDREESVERQALSVKDREESVERRALSVRDREESVERRALSVTSATEVPHKSGGDENETPNSTLNAQRSTLQNFPAGALIVDLAQPQGRLARAFLEPDADFEPEFVKEQLARLERNDQRHDAEPKEGYGFYDITAWALPYTYGLAAFWTEDAPEVAQRALIADAEGHVRLKVQAGGVDGGKAQVAYLFPYDRDASAFLALRLLQEGYRLQAVTKPMRAGGRDWPRGTLIAFVGRNPETLHTRIAALAKGLGVEVTAIQSGYGDTSAVTLGAGDVEALSRPSIAVVVDDRVDSTSYGALWYLFARTVGLDFTPVSMRALQEETLARFNVLIFPDGGGYLGALGKDGAARLKAWVGAGNVLIGLGGGGEWFYDKSVGLSSATVVGEAEEGDKAAKADGTKPKRPVSLPGGIFRARIDPTHFLGYGYPDGEIVVPVIGDTFLKPSKEGANVVTFGKGPSHLAGFIWPHNTEELLANTAYVIDEPVGAGHALLFLNDPNFRALWAGLRRCFLAGIVYGPHRTALKPDGE